MTSLFDPVVSDDKLHPAFVQVSRGDIAQATRRMMDEVFAKMGPQDANFVEQLQTTGFDQRVFELALFAALRALGFTVEFPDPAPDFECTLGDSKFFVEATTANASMVDGKRKVPVRSVDEFKDQLEVAVDVDRDEIAVRMGSALFSKAQRCYHELDHVREYPFVLAIEPFFDVGALLRSETALERFLYGRDFAIEERGRDLFVQYIEVGDHHGTSKTVPSGFFQSPDNEAISAVIFSNCHTTAKFNRIGFERGFAVPGSRMFRSGYKFNSDPGALKPEEFSYEVGSSNEGWAHGLVVMHNPRARHPLDRGMFHGLTQTWEEDHSLRVDMADPHIYSSWTQSAVPNVGK